MAIVLDHTIVPAHDKEASARFLARILGLRYEGPLSHFAPLRVNDTLTLDFDNDTKFESHHYAFKVDEAEFDGIFDRVRAEGIAYGRGPGSLADMKINHRRGGRGFYFRDPTAHVLQLLTAKPHRSPAHAGSPASGPPPQGPGNRSPHPGGRRASDTNALRDGNGPSPPPQRVKARCGNGPCTESGEGGCPPIDVGNGVTTVESAPGTEMEDSRGALCRNRRFFGTVERLGCGWARQGLDGRESRARAGRLCLS